MAAMIAHATTAQAQFALPSARIVGAGSSAIANTIRQAGDCYGLKSNLGVGISKASPYPVGAIAVVDFDFDTPYADALGNRFNCAANAANSIIATSPYGGPQFAVGRIVQPNIAVAYLSVGSGEGVAAFVGGRVSSSIRISSNFSDLDGFDNFGYDPTNCALLVGRDCPGYDNADGYQFSFSETPISEFNAYSLTPISPFGRYNGIDPGSRSALGLFGAPIQVPVAIVPVAIAYSPIYAKQRNSDGSISAYRLTIGNARADGSGGLRLTRAQYCAIFNGTLTNWNQLPTTVVNKDPADTRRNWATTGLPMYPVGRADAAGTTTLLNRALAAQCEGLSINTGVNGGGPSVAIQNKFRTPNIRLPHGYRPLVPGTIYDSSGPDAQSISGAFFDKFFGKFRDQYSFPPGAEYYYVNGVYQAEFPGLFTIAEGDDGVAMATAYLPDPGPSPGDSTSNGRIAYVSPEQALPAILFNGTNNYGLQTASLQVNGFGYTYAAPDAKNATAAFAGIQPPQSKGTAGQYCVGSADCVTSGNRGDARDWVQGTNSFPFATVARPTKGYPIIGTSNALLYTCYATAERRQAIDSFFATLLGKTTKDHNNQILSANIFVDPINGLFARNGLAPMPAAWRTAITETFLKRSTQVGKVGDLTTRLGDRNLWIQDKLAFISPVAPSITTGNPVCVGRPGA